MVRVDQSFNERMLVHLTTPVQWVAQISAAIQRNTANSSSVSVQFLCRFRKPGAVGGRALATASGPAISGTLIPTQLLSSRHALVQIPLATENLKPNVIVFGSRIPQYTQRFSMPLPTASRSVAAVAGESTPSPTTRKNSRPWHCRNSLPLPPWTV